MFIFIYLYYNQSSHKPFSNRYKVLLASVNVPLLKSYSAFGLSQGALMNIERRISFGLALCTLKYVEVSMQTLDRYKTRSNAK